MMFAFTFLCISFLVSLVHASPLGLRSVFSPHITSPNEKSVWPVGTKQFVTWETDNIPPDSELTNPNGKVVLGHLGSDGGLNLDIDHPLAQNFKLRVGKIQVTVPNVAPREDYIVVLFGDSGNASPAFAITKITTGANAGTTTQGGGKATSVTDLTSLISTPIPITGSTITGGSSQATNTGEPTTDVPTWSTTDTSSVPTATSPAPSSTSGTSSGTTAPATTPSNAASPFQANGWKVTAGLASAILAILI